MPKPKTYTAVQMKALTITEHKNADREMALAKRIFQQKYGRPYSNRYEDLFNLMDIIDNLGKPKRR